ncbi:class I SAM-dependent methyltransferase [Citrobacter sp. Res13-Sevr-PEB04-36]|uniref:class I SAM-dependent methyltransferase n=1 Tax=Citrobacter sp. Res13-Sevr-PEB04-36 TaxID=2777960 RepID=UPI0018ACD4BE|nr:class I SAM-dependent methyltransferase [Citrobacter sp. Res13-Sevr-PEB04-36]
MPVVWLDADATLERKPELFSSLNADFAIHKWTWDIENPDSGWQFASGTLYFGKTDLAGKLLKQWVLRCHSDPFTWDQEHLSSAWCDINCLHPLKTFFLAREYLQIDGATEFSPPVIKYWQASRLLKKRNESVFHEVLKITDEGKFNRQINCLWRTPEELFWIDEGVSNIIPNTKFEYPEGDYLKDMLFDAIEGSFPVLEIGCGIGRIAKLFDADKYIGVDVNPNALVKARNVLPTHYFRIHDKGCCYPKATSVLLYTVLLHISDSVIYDFLKEVCNNKTKIVISELMDTRWRRGGNPPVYNRDPEDYILLMSELGFKLMKSIKREYERYNRSPWNIGRDSRITTLVFENNR